MSMKKNQPQFQFVKKMFLRTLGYSSDEGLRTSQSSTGEADVVQGSKRGKHEPKHKIT